MILFLKTLNYTTKIMRDELKPLLKTENVDFVPKIDILINFFNNFESKYL